MKTVLFPGQGSQAKGMGGTLFDEYAKWVKKADEILSYSIKELCLENPENRLKQTQFTQPALYVVNALSYLKKIDESGRIPDFVAGHSLGEFNALLAAECFDFETGLKLVQKRGELMSRATGGGMAAVLNAGKEEIEAILRDNGFTQIDLANFNTPDQIVISGMKEEIESTEPFFKGGKMRYHRLNTSGAFHSRFMQPVREEFEAALSEVRFSNCKIPVIANFTARPYENDRIADTLANQITGSVKWFESIRYLMGLSEMEFEEVGHGKVLTKMVRTIEKKAPRPQEQSPVPSRPDSSDLSQPNSRGLSQSDSRDLSQPGSPDLSQSDSWDLSQPDSRDHSQPDSPDFSQSDSRDLAQSDSRNISQPDSPALSQSDSWDLSQPDSRDRLEPSSQAQLGVTEHPPATELTAEEKVLLWNQQYPIGTKVKSEIIEEAVLETRTEAVVLFGHRAAVYMEEYNGYFDLDEVTPC